MKMKKYSFLVLISTIIFSFSAIGQNPYVINKFDVSIILNTDGSFSVTENIKLNFQVEQRGIIRQIPVIFTAENNTNQIFDTPLNHSGDYTIFIDNVIVENNESEISFSGNYLEIKIGSLGTYLIGEQNYKISYTVWGALNQFTDFTEFAWNITGDNWNAEIQEASYSITLPQTAKITTDSISVFTGIQGSKDSNATKNISGKIISGKTTSVLSAGQGLKAFVNLPSNLFNSVNIPLEKITNTQYLKNLDLLININSDGSIDFTETRKYVLLTANSVFTKVFPVNDVKDLKFRNLILENTFVDIKNNGKNVEFDTVFSVLPTEKSLLITTLEQLLDTVTITISAKIWGAIDFSDSLARLSWEIIEKDIDIPIEKTTFKITSDKKIKLKEGNFLILKPDIPESVSYSLNDDNTITGYQNYIEPSKHFFQIIFNTSEENFQTKNIPVEVYAKDFYIDNFNTKIIVLEDGTLHIKHTFDVCFKPGSKTDYYGTFSFGTRIQDKYEKSFLPGNGGLELVYPKWRILGNYLFPLIYDIESSNSSFHKDSWSRLFTWEVINEDSSNVVTFDYEYKIFNVLKSDGDNYILNYPIIPAFNEPIKNGTFTLFLPETSDEGIQEFKGYIIDPEKNEREFLMLAKSSTLSGEFSNLLNNNVPIIKISFSKKYITKAAVGKKIKLLARNNKPVIIFLIIFVILLVVWYLYGRDTASEVTEKYYAPEGITSAEAGFLWDNKLHKRDLISLLISWATLGYIEIAEIEKGKEYKLTKRNGVPSQAIGFEKILYSAIFKENANEVLLSSLRFKIFPSVKQTEKDFKRFSSTQNFYKPGTIGFSRFLIILSIIFATISGFSFLINAHQSDFQAGIFYFVVAALFFAFGKIMPKYGSFGNVKYAELLGLKHFIENSTLTKLEELVEKDPEYFSKVLPYSIVMGVHQTWAKKFEAISKDRPDWYKYPQSQGYTPSLFTARIIEFMNRVNIVFHLRPPKQSSNSGNFFKSFSGGSYKSSGSSSKKYSSSSSYKSSSSNKSSSSFKSSSTRSSSSKPKNGGGGGKSW